MDRRSPILSKEKWADFGTTIFPSRKLWAFLAALIAWMFDSVPPVDR
jgi:hypothetical protein